MIWHEIIWWYLFLVPVLWLLQNYIHEKSHALVYQGYGRKTTVIPFMHWYEIDKEITRYGFIRPKEEGNWYFYFARLDYSKTDNIECLSDKAYAYMYIAPRITNTLFMCISYSCYLIFFSYSHIQTVLLLFYFINGVDAVVGWGPMFYWWDGGKTTDIYLFHIKKGWSKLKIRILAIGWVLIALFLLLFPISKFF